MARRLKFSTYRSDSDKAEPIEIEINEGNVFFFRPTIPGINLLTFLEGADSDSNAVASKAVRELFEAALVADPAEFPETVAEIPEDNAASFFAYISNPDNNVDLTHLQEIANGLVEELAGDRPTRQSSSPSDGSATNGSGSTGKRSAKAATSTA